MEPITMIAAGILFLAGAAFAVFLGTYSERLEARRHAETH